MKITPKIKRKVLDLRAQGLSYPKIAKATKISASSVTRIVKEESKPKPDPDGPIDAKVLKPCPNPRIILIYFKDDKTDFAKCVARIDRQYPVGYPLKVKKVETSEERLYRLV